MATRHRLRDALLLFVSSTMMVVACGNDAVPISSAVVSGTAPTVVTSTTGAATTTSTTGISVPPRPPECRPDPFSQEVVDQIALDYPQQRITAHVYDTRTGCEYSLNPENLQPTASVFKVLVMAGTLFEAQSRGSLPTDWEMSQLSPMITESANEPVRALWSSYGGSPWFGEMARQFGLDDTTITADSGTAWGLTLTSAADQVDLLRQVLLGQWGPLENQYRIVARQLMTSVVPDQTWGVTAGVPRSYQVAHKNGFAGVTINSVGWVDEPGQSAGYVVAILSTGWPDHPSGILAVEMVNRLVALAMIDRVAGAS